jgi:hypothetical protein
MVCHKLFVFLELTSKIRTFWCGIRVNSKRLHDNSIASDKLQNKQNTKYIYCLVSPVKEVVLFVIGIKNRNSK